MVDISLIPSSRIASDNVVTEDSTKLIQSGAVKTFVDAAIAAIPVIGDASETAKGKIQLATTAEITTGTDNTKAVTPAKLKAVTDVIEGNITDLGDDKLDKNIATSLVSEATWAQTTTAISQTINTVSTTDGTVTPVTTTLQPASATQIGLMPAASFNQILANTAAIEALENKQSIFATTDLPAPEMITAEDLDNVIDEHSSRAPQGGDTIDDLTNGTSYRFYEDDTTGIDGTGWHNVATTVALATNTSAGIVQGSASGAGTIFVEEDGTMAVNGWDDITGDITDIEATLTNKVNKNADIIGATKTKITYDTKGLVTAGTDAEIADITGLQTALDAKLNHNMTYASAEGISAQGIGYNEVDLDTGIGSTTQFTSLHDGTHIAVNTGYDVINRPDVEDPEPYIEMSLSGNGDKTHLMIATDGAYLTVNESLTYDDAHKIATLGNINTSMTTVEKLTNKSTDIEANTGSDVYYPSVAAVETYVADQLADFQALPAGGTAGQVLSKVSGTDYDVAWTTPSAMQMFGIRGVTSETTTDLVLGNEVLSNINQVMMVNIGNTILLPQTYTLSSDGTTIELNNAIDEGMTWFVLWSNTIVTDKTV